MKDFKSLAVLLIVSFVLSMIACKNSEKTAILNEEVGVLKSIKTPIVGGARVSGMKIILNIEKQKEVRLDSIVYNGKSGEISELKTMAEGFWVECYFYNEKEIIEGKGWLEYKAEGNTCKLYYSINETTKSILISSLELKQDTTLWK